MGGKVSLLLVLSFGAVFAIFSNKMLDTKGVATSNYAFYFNKSQAHYLSVSGIHMALTNLNQISHNWTPSNPYPIAGGQVNIFLQTPSDGMRAITSVANYNGRTDTVIVTAKQKSFAEYGNYYQLFNNVWAATGDTFDGKFHANDWVQCYGDPVFLGKVTTTRGVKLYDSKSNPEFHEGWKLQSSDAVQFDTSSMRIAAFTNGKVFRDTTGANRRTEVKMTFNSNGTVTYSYRIGTGSWSVDKTEALSAITPNGLIYVERGNAYIQGTINGQATIVTSHRGDSNAGVVYVENTMQYASDPKINPASSDLLGLVAERRIEIPFNASRGDFKLEAAMFSMNGGLTVRDYANYPAAYKMDILGSIIGQKVEATAKYVWSGTLKKYIPTNGYSYIHKYDPRFDITAPPFFPKLRIFVPIAWYEGQVEVPAFY